MSSTRVQRCTATSSESLTSYVVQYITATCEPQGGEAIPTGCIES
jgi:hypothetical protein